MHWSFKFVLTVVIAFASFSFAEPIPADPPLRWWKGNTHTHTLWSDGDDFPEMVVEWYVKRNYHFLGLSDHNVLSQGQKWMPVPTIEKRAGKTGIDKYVARFGESWVEVRDMPDAPKEIRLKPLSEFRSFFEEPGKFLMIPAEEISDAFEGRPAHIGAINILEAIKPQKGKSMTETIDNNLRAIHEMSDKTGQAMFAHLNHPNFRWGVTAEELAHALEENYFEVFNGHPGVNQLGDEIHASVDRIWDIANTLRLKQLNAPPLYGLGTDDSHYYHNIAHNRAISGRGWIMVRARHLTPESLIRAIKAGDFYASSGVTLRDLSYSDASKELRIEIEPDGDATFTTHFIGSPKSVDITSRPVPTTQPTTRPLTQLYSDDVGKTFAKVEGLTATYKLTGDELYVRAVVVSSKPPEFPVWKTQLKQAWTQPVGWTMPAKQTASENR